MKGMNDPRILEKVKKRIMARYYDPIRDAFVFPGAIVEAKMLDEPGGIEYLEYLFYKDEEWSEDLE